MPLNTVNDLRELIRHNWEDIDRLFPDLRLCLLSLAPGEKEDLRVERATKSQLDIWPRLQGKVCWKHVNQSSKICSWCPVLKAIHTNQMQTALSRSPKPQKESDGSLGFDLSSSEMEYANLGALPLGSDDEGKRYAL